jgi:hypothetical protein
MTVRKSTKALRFLIKSLTDKVNYQVTMINPKGFGVTESMIPITNCVIIKNISESTELAVLVNLISKQPARLKS